MTDAQTQEKAAGAAYDDEDMLTPEERAAFEADEGAEINGSASLEMDREAWANSGWGPPEPPAAEGTAAPAEGEDSAPAGEDTAPAAGQDDPAAAAQQGAEQPAPQQAPEPPADLPDPQKVQAKLDDVKKRRKEALDGYDDGDLTKQELDEKLAALDGEYEQAQKARFRIEAYQEQQETAWRGAVQSFVRDRGFAGNQQALVGLNEVVKMLNAPGSPTAYLSDAEILDLAHRNLVAMAPTLGIAEVPPLPDAAPAQAKEAPKQQQASAEDEKTKETLSTPPRTLLDVPSSDVNGADDGRYAALNRIMDSGDPEKIEAALAQLSDEERNYFSSYNG